MTGVMDASQNSFDSLVEHPIQNVLLSHLLTVGGFLLAFLTIARLISERKQPSNTFAWLLAIAFIPYVGVPLYLLLGGRKIKRLAAKKAPLCPRLPGAFPSPAATTATAKVLMFNGSSPPLGGNRVEFIMSGEDAFAKLERGIREAKHTIHIMTFILGHDAVGRRIISLLAQRAREGVKVRLLLDSLGCFRTSGRFCNPLRQAGGEVVKFMPVLPIQTRGSANLRNHRKIVIIDHQIAALGGRNLAMEYMGPTFLKKRWLDFGAVVEGPAAGLLNEIFLADWAFASGQPISKLNAERALTPVQSAGESEVQIAASGPDVLGEPLYEGILSLVQQATRSIWICTPYFIPDEVLFRSLLVQARAGTDVRLVVPSRSNHPITDVARRYYLRELRAAGAKVLMYGPDMTHAKMLLVDESIGLMGSANMDLRSLFVNFEVGMVIYSPREAKVMSTWMQEVFEQSTIMKAPPKKRRIVSTIGEEIARLVAPLL